MSESSWPRGGVYLVLITMGEDVAVMYDSRRMEVIGFDTLQAACDHFEVAYDRRHTSGNYERSMSACVHYIFFAPRVFFVRYKKDLVALAQEPLELVEQQTVAGSMTGLLLKRKEGRAVYEKATAVRLIKSEQEPGAGLDNIALYPD